MATILTPVETVRTSTESTTTQIKLPESKRWADVSDDEKEAIESLAIEEPKKVNKFLKNSESSSIKVVFIVWLLAIRRTRQQRDLNLLDELLQELYVEMKFERSSKIQAITLPMILS